MSPCSVIVAVEDDLSEAIVRRLLLSAGPDLGIAQVLGKRGKSYLEAKVPAFNQTAAGIPFVVLTDLDSDPCPAELRLSWCRAPLNENMILRVAVHEVEAWLLADRESFANFLGISSNLLPHLSEWEPDPKALIIRLARRSRRRHIREGLVPRQGSTARQGPAYNLHLIEYVNGEWSIDNAAQTCPSLRSAIRAIAQLYRRVCVPQ